MKEKGNTLLHFVFDEKFIDCVIDNFSRTDYNNVFCCFTKTDKMKYIKQIEKLMFVHEMQEFVSIANSGYKVIFLHSLFVPPELLIKINKNTKIIWLSWGYDIYSDRHLFSSRKLIRLNMFEPQTRKYISPQATQEYLIQIKNILKHKIKSLLRIDDEESLYWKFAKRADYISTVLPTEYDMIIKHNKKKVKAKYFLHRYLTETDNFMFDLNENGNNILIGNSPSETNNHLDIFELLKKRGVTDRNLIIPLNYRQHETYKRYLKRYFETNKFSIFSPIYDFLPFEQYKEILATCQYAIFGHKRQQAMGNIYLMLCGGAKIFLYKDSIAYQYLMQQGYTVFDINHDLSVKSLNTPLPEKDKIHNRQLFSENMNYEDYISSLNNAIHQLFHTESVGIHP
ncbi:MAG: TDP-N-acetylfucosamine:lipid II N-acetylfucosaminyltransferase [Candidatus Symbiothrix sp.]|jgi:hypothetical protein|nr:TDP-N-acetylfucosamine:lipid II N-acetylfucosaminyltransferase [Candidatus Symbiothrix sp.]